MFPFNANIPAANNNPSDDQPLMLQNNQSTMGLIGVNHVTFNENTGGFHTSITFDTTDNYAPTPPVNPPELFINTVDGFGTSLPAGLPELFYYSGSQAQSAHQYAAATPGSTFLFGGIILKWGLVTVGTSTVNFVSAFPNNCFSVTMGYTTGSANITSISASGFTCTTGGGFYYIAIGN